MGEIGRRRLAVGERNRPQSSVPTKRPDLRLSPPQKSTVNSPFIVSRHVLVPIQSVGISTRRESRSATSGCLVRPSRTPKRPKSAWPKLTKVEPKTHRSGLSTAESEIGTVKRPGENDRGKGIRPRLSKQSTSVSFTYCLFLLFAASEITIASHNLHGFKKSSAYHRSCLQRHEGVWLGQETWLSEKQFSSMKSLGCQYVARSAMEDALSSGILRGRPFGGVSIAWSPKLDGVIKPITNFRHKRVVGVEIDSENNKTLIINIYMPFFDASKREACMVETIDAISMIETIIDSHPLHSIIIGGDFNTELKGDSPFDTFWNDFCAKFDLIKCDNFVSNSNPTTYTYSHDSLGQRKWNDHFLISRRLENSTINHTILNEGENPSDHLPILFSLSIPLTPTRPSVTETKEAKLRWEKITVCQKQQYANQLSNLVESSQWPLSTSPCQASCHCSETKCHETIQAEYDYLLFCLKTAAAPLPRHKPGVEKDWWTTNLTHLRDQSISIHRRWEALGKPNQGLIHSERIKK